MRYTTELTEPVGFYLRGEEYSAQIDHFVERVETGRLSGLNGFESAAVTDSVIAMMLADARKGASTRIDGEADRAGPQAVATIPFRGPRPQPAHVRGRFETRG